MLNFSSDYMNIAVESMFNFLAKQLANGCG